MNFYVYIFFSFQMASLFLELVGHVDLITNSETIKNLFKIPLSRDSVILYDI